MAFRLRDKKSAADELRRILRAEASKARAQLCDPCLAPELRVHRARQRFKRMRAVLRLIKPAAPYVFSVENRVCRDLARELSLARDAAAVVEAVDQLADRHREDPGACQSLRMLRDSLHQRARRAMEGQLQGVEVRIEAVCDALAQLDRRLRGLPVDEVRRRDVRRGARQNWRQCRRGYELARDSADDEAFHEWRKPVKYAYHHTALLAELRPRWSLRNRQSLNELSERLGHLQDLALLERLVAEQPDTLNIDLHLQRLRRLLRVEQADLRRRTLAHGGALFAGDGLRAAAVLEFPRAYGQVAGR